MLCSITALLPVTESGVCGVRKEQTEENKKQVKKERMRAH